MKSLHHPERDDLSLSNVLYALSDPIRRRIIQTLAVCGDSPCGTLGLDVAKSNMSYHFRVLREAGIIRQRSAGTLRINCLRRGDLDARFPGLLDAILQADARTPAEQVHAPQRDTTGIHP